MTLPLKLPSAFRAYGPPPTVWWSTPELMPAPWLGVQVSPSLSVNDIKLTFEGRSCDTNVRLVLESVNKIGSKDVTEVFWAGLFSQVARSEEERRVGKEGRSRWSP